MCADDIYAKSVDQALFQVISWVGILKDILTNQGTLFMSCAYEHLRKIKERFSLDLWIKRKNNDLKKQSRMTEKSLTPDDYEFQRKRFSKSICLLFQTLNRKQLSNQWTNLWYSPTFWSCEHSRVMKVITEMTKMSKALAGGKTKAQSWKKKRVSDIDLLKASLFTKRKKNKQSLTRHFLAVTDLARTYQSQNYCLLLRF